MAQNSAIKERITPRISIMTIWSCFHAFSPIVNRIGPKNIKGSAIPIRITPFLKLGSIKFIALNKGIKKAEISFGFFLCFT
jgi:hypothetical protein